MTDCLAQLHMHTFESSACGIDDGATMARAAYQLGYRTIVVTDHFFNANSRAPRDAAWEDKLDVLAAGYRAAKAEGEKIGLTVLFGWETCNGGPEYLTYGLGLDFLRANPDIDRLDARAYIARVREAGAFVAQAHPFRRARYIPLFTPDPTLVEAFEVMNAAHYDETSSHSDPTYDPPADEMARANGLIRIAGSDAHGVARLRGGAMRFPRPITTNGELIAALRAREGELIRLL